MSNQRMLVLTIEQEFLENWQRLQGAGVANENQLALRPCQGHIKPVGIGEEVTQQAGCIGCSAGSEGNDNHLALAALETINGINSQRKVEYQSLLLTCAVFVE